MILHRYLLTCGFWTLLSNTEVPIRSATVSPPTFNESFDYSINWPSGLSLGEAHWKARNSGTAQAPTWDFEFSADARIPGFSIVEHYRSTASANLCGERLTREFHRGARKGSETEIIDRKTSTAIRKTTGGGESTITVSDCAKDALTFLYFVRRELASGRITPSQTVLLGAPYEVKVTLLGTNMVQLANRSVQADRVGCAIRGPKAKLDFEVNFARDALRTPVMVKIPLALGNFFLELMH